MANGFLLGVIERDDWFERNFHSPQTSPSCCGLFAYPWIRLGLMCELFEDNQTTTLASNAVLLEKISTLEPLVFLLVEFSGVPYSNGDFLMIIQMIRG